MLSPVHLRAALNEQKLVLLIFICPVFYYFFWNEPVEPRASHSYEKMGFDQSYTNLTEDSFYKVRHTQGF